MRRALLAAALAAGATAAPAAADDRGTCRIDGDVTYTTTAVGFVALVDLGPCRLAGKVGRVRMTAQVVRTDLVTGARAVTKAKPVRCATRARTCTIRLRLPHEPTEAARYDARMAYESDGARELVAGGILVQVKCYSVAARHASCFVPV